MLSAVWALTACTGQRSHSCVIPPLRPRVEADTLPREALAPGTVRGIVIDRESNQPMRDAYVRLLPGPQRQRSDSVGRFKFADVSAGSHTLDALAIGWRMPPIAIRTAPDSGVYAVLVLNRDTTPQTCVTTAAGY